MAFSVGLVAALSGCAVSSDSPSASAPRGDSLELRDGAPAAEAEAPRPPLRELEAGVDGLGLRISPRVLVEEEGGATVWRVLGSASVPLGSVASWVPDDAYGRAELTGPRSFAITFRDPSEQNTMASGLPLFVTVAPAQGARAEAAIWFRPRLEASPGTSRIQPAAAIAPVWVAGEEGLGHLEYRGKVTTASSWQLASVAGSAPPRLSALDAKRARLTWSFAALAATAEQAAPQLTLIAQRGGGAEAASRLASLEIRAIRLALTREDPRQVWPSSCEPLVRACLRTLPSLEADTEPCGTYRQILACGGPGGARQPPSELF